MTVHDFGDELRKGKRGENEFKKKYSQNQFITFEHSCENGNITDTDFTINNHGVELKSDSYSLNTGNYFIERYSDKDAKTDGGPWQAKAKNAKYFVYHYLGTEYYAWFELTTEFFEILEEMISELSPIKITNKTWVTLGYKVNRDEFINRLPSNCYEIEN